MKVTSLVAVEAPRTGKIPSVFLKEKKIFYKWYTTLYN